MTGRYTRADEEAIRAELQSAEPPAAEPLGPDLRKHLMDEYTGTSWPQRRASHWVMNAEWWDEVTDMARAMGENPPPWPRTLLGLPVKVRADGGVPHLERGP